MNVKRLIKAFSIAIVGVAAFVAIMLGLFWLIESAPIWVLVCFVVLTTALGITPAIYSSMEASSRGR